ncbi:MAG: hypothetical protein U5K43_05945 [Halofilum sp. (in: g-proteobacteria)]|nr:hypothetical protein [Halofilum sp. (in: g-proteobacteria)]
MQTHQVALGIGLGLRAVAVGLLAADVDLPRERWPPLARERVRHASAEHLRSLESSAEAVFGS